MAAALAQLYDYMTSKATGCHRGPKRKLRAGFTECRHYNGWAGYRAPSLKRTSCPKCLHYNARHMLRCVFIVK